MTNEGRLQYLDNLRTALIFLVVLFHAGAVYESSGFMAPFWIVDDPATSDLPGLLNLILDIFVMPTFFFISGFFVPEALDRKSPWSFLKSKFRRLMVPWIIAVFTLMPLYKIVFLASRGLPQETWTTYFHFSNGILSMSWLWFLPVLFLFDVLFVLLRSLGIRLDSIPPVIAAGAAFVLGLSSSLAVSILGLTGWTKTPFIDFQNERLLTYFLVFIVGSVWSRHDLLDSPKRNMKLYIAVNATAWIPINIYVITLLNYFLRPDTPLISENADLLLLWFGFHLSLWALLYCVTSTFRYFVNKKTRIWATLSRTSYGVYIIHIAVMGPIALALLGLGASGLTKYPLLALTTYAVSNVLVYAFARVTKILLSRSQRTTAPVVDPLRSPSPTKT